MGFLNGRPTPEEAETWKIILQRHAEVRESQVCDLFLKGVETLKINENKIPELQEVNTILKARTDFQGIFVDGLEEGPSFYKLLSKRKFPVGNFIRSRADLSYTPAPDIVHDLYGHLPFYTDPAYADFSQAFATAAVEASDRPELLLQFERFFWFTAEFGLVETPRGLRVFGAGIASSTAECEYALSSNPTHKSFNIDDIRYQDFRIDQMQKILFVLESPDQLYSSLGEFRHRVNKDGRRFITNHFSSGGRS